MNFSTQNTVVNFSEYFASIPRGQFSRENYNLLRMTQGFLLANCLQAQIIPRLTPPLAILNLVRRLKRIELLRKNYCSLGLKMFADTILILFISVATALLSEGM